MTTLHNFIAKRQLPAAFAATAERYFVPLAEWLHGKAGLPREGAFVLGINGAQGAGKTTLAAFLADYLHTQWGDNVATLSIDDLYLPKAEREELARTVHPLLATRGVPGTHDAELGCAVIDRLTVLNQGETLQLPRFDKLSDDRLPAADWPSISGPVDVVLFEGWCVGSRPVAADDLAETINTLERTRDPTGEWRRYANRQLGAHYQSLFARLDALVFMAVPDFDCVRRWRTDQEQQLLAAPGSAAGQGRDAAPVSPEMAGQIAARITEFVEYFERISRDNLHTLPQRADVVLRLGRDHQVIGADYRD